MFYNNIMENDELKKSIDKLSKSVEKSNNLWWMIFRGIFYSVGWVFGLTLIGIIAFYILRHVSADSQIGKLLQAISNVITKNQ